LVAETNAATGNRGTELTIEKPQNGERSLDAEADIAIPGSILKDTNLRPLYRYISHGKSPNFYPSALQLSGKTLHHVNPLPPSDAVRKQKKKITGTF